jgi:hypothetical protein
MRDKMYRPEVDGPKRPNKPVPGIQKLPIKPGRPSAGIQKLPIKPGTPKPGLRPISSITNKPAFDKDAAKKAALSAMARKAKP